MSTKLPKEAIYEFQQIHKARTGETLSWEGASKAAHELIEFSKLVIEIAKTAAHKKSSKSKSPMDLE